MNGIPENYLDDDEYEDEDSEENPEGCGHDNTGQEATNMIENLINSPQFLELREQARENPAVIQNWLAGLEVSNPAIFGFLSQNPDLLEQIFLGNDDDDIEIDDDNVNA